MSKVNFVSEFNLFMRFARDNSLSMRERMFWIALFYIANDRATFNEQTQEYDWPDDFIQVSNGEINLYCCLDKRAIETLRNGLKQRGLIDFQPGQKNKRNPAYKINYLSVNVGNKIAPNTDPNNVSSTDPNNAPNTDPNNVSNIDPSSVPNNTENAEVLGTKMHPTVSPYSKYKSSPNQTQSRLKGKPNGGSEQRSTSERDGWQAKPFTGEFGFLDMGETGKECVGFVPLPWEEGCV